MEIETVKTDYSVRLKASEYDFLEFSVTPDDRMTVKFLDTRWRTREETIALFEECIEVLKKFGELIH